MCIQIHNHSACARISNRRVFFSVHQGYGSLLTLIWRWASSARARSCHARPWGRQTRPMRFAESGNGTSNLHGSSTSPRQDPPHRRGTATKRQTPNGICPDFQMAEGEGFEPSYPRRGKRFSRPPHSTTLPPLRGVKSGAPSGTPLDLLAESLGFEPRIRFRRIHDFQSCSFGHSDNSPGTATASIS